MTRPLFSCVRVMVKVPRAAGPVPRHVPEALPTVIVLADADALPPRPSLTVTDGVKEPPCVNTRVKLAAVAVDPSPTVHANVRASESGSVAVATNVNVVSP